MSRLGWNVSEWPSRAAAWQRAEAEGSGGPESSPVSAAGDTSLVLGCMRTTRGGLRGGGRKACRGHDRKMFITVPGTVIVPNKHQLGGKKGLDPGSSRFVYFFFMSHKSQSNLRSAFPFQ